MRQVADRIYALGSGTHNFYLIVMDDQVTIVDLGCHREWDKLIGALDGLGLGPGSVAGALVTHVHGDHFGLGARAQDEGIDVRVHHDDEIRALGRYEGKPSASATDLPLFRLRTWKTMFPLLRAGVTTMNHVESVATIEDGEQLDMPGRPRVVHTPGHTEGHVMFHSPDLGVLFTGDGLATMDLVGKRQGPQLMYRAFNNNQDAALASLERIVDLDADMLLPGHGQPFVGSPAAAVESARSSL